MRFKVIGGSPAPLRCFSLRLDGSGVRRWTAKPIADPVLRLNEGGTGTIGFDFPAETANVRAQHLMINGIISPKLRRRFAGRCGLCHGTGLVRPTVCTQQVSDERHVHRVQRSFCPMQPF